MVCSYCYNATSDDSRKLYSVYTKMPHFEYFTKLVTRHMNVLYIILKPIMSYSICAIFVLVHYNFAILQVIEHTHPVLSPNQTFIAACMHFMYIAFIV